MGEAPYPRKIVDYVAEATSLDHPRGRPRPARAASAMRTGVPTERFSLEEDPVRAFVRLEGTGRVALGRGTMASGGGGRESWAHAQDQEWHPARCSGAARGLGPGWAACVETCALIMARADEFFATLAECAWGHAARTELQAGTGNGEHDGAKRRRQAGCELTLSDAGAARVSSAADLALSC